MIKSFLVKFFRTIVITTAITLSTALSALAAQDAMVTTSRAPIHEKPSHESKIIETKNVGDKLRVSSFNRDGWFKTRSSNGKLGWIWQSDLGMVSDKETLPADAYNFNGKSRTAQRSRVDPTLFFRAGGFGTALASAEINKRLGASTTSPFYGFGGFGELAFTVTERSRLAMRLMTLTTSGTLVKDGVSYDTTFSDLPLLVGIDTDLYRGGSFDFAIGLYGGWNLQSEATVTASTFVEPNGFTFSSSTFAFLLNFSGKWALSQRLRFVGEFGFFYAAIPQTAIATGFNGDAPFRSANGQLSTLPLHHMGGILGLALQLGF